jgi:hypothetical protein
MTFTSAESEFFRVVADKHDPVARVDWPTAIETEEIIIPSA